MSFSLWTTSDGTTSASLTLPPATATVISASSVIFLDTSNSMYIGASSGSFTGFLYEFLIYVYPQDVSTLTVTACSTSSSTGCLWNVDIGHYLSGSTVTSCSASCTNGCVRGTDCNLCSESTCSACVSFTSACLTCSSNGSIVSNVCQCNANYYMDASNQCISCPSGTFSINGGACTACNPSCLTCSGTSSSCLSCNTYAYLSGIVCTCSLSYYWTGSVCSACNARCQTCSNAIQCNTCIPNAALDSSNVCTCIASSYWTGTACCACDPSCLTCSGASSNCLSCNTDASLSGGVCTCNPSYYWTGSVCSTCNARCQTCSNAMQCNTCIPNAALDSSNVCTCIASFYWTGTACSACYSECQYCTGSLNTDCLGCFPNANIQSDGSCACGSDSGFVWDGRQCACNLFQYVSGSTCMPCDPTCPTCSGPNSNECLSCVIHASPSNGYCLCYAGRYWDGISACQACDASCAQCTGPTAYDCTCLDHSTLIEKVCVCDEGYYMDTNACLPCHSSCLACTGPTYYQCTSCLDYLLELVCLSACPIGFLESSNNCTIQNTNSPTLEFVFNTIQGVFYDNISHAGAVTGDNDRYYPNLDTSDPVPAYGRGIYFTGTGSYLALPYPDANLLLFGIRFSISVWINPDSVNGTLFYKAESASLFFSVSCTHVPQ